MSKATPTPWWETLTLRDEIADKQGAISDVRMSLYEAVHGRRGGQVAYADPTYYGEITYPTGGLVALMAAVAVRLGSTSAVETARAVWRADQAMGGGKSHGLIGLWHMATDPAAFRDTDVGQAVWAEAQQMAGKGTVAKDLGVPHVVVLSCDNMTPGRPDQDIDGPAVTLAERFLWRLFGEDNALYKRYRQDVVNNKAKLAEAIDAVGRPVLILVDEILDYLRAATAEGENELAVQDMGFLRTLLEVVAKTDNCVLVMVMIASDKDVVAMSEFGERCRAQLDKDISANGKPTTVTSGADFADIIRRRLFKTSPASEVLDATVASHLDHMTGPWAENVFSKLPWANPTEFEREVRRGYPFHPGFIHLAEKEWSHHAGFQKVRSTLQVFAATVWALQQRARSGGWAPLLIGPGDVPLDNHDAREALLGSGIIEAREAVASYREIAKTDVIADDGQRGNARQIDVERDPSLFSEANPRVAERIATGLFLYSLASRGGNRGATESEAKAAGFVPHQGCTVTDVEAVVEVLKGPVGLRSLDPIAGKGGQERRLHLSTRQTLNMFYSAERAAVSDTERDQILAETARRLATAGPFGTLLHVEADDATLAMVADGVRGAKFTTALVSTLAGAGIDKDRTNRLVVLDPRAFTLLNGQDDETKAAMEAAFGLGDRGDRLAVAWASSCVFAVANTQRRAQARAVATEYLAWKRVSEIEAVIADEGLAQQAKDSAKEARGKLEQKVKAAFQHVAYVGEEIDPATNVRSKVVRYSRFDKDNHSSLDGSIVWSDLDSADKAFAPETFDAKALLNNLRDHDWGLPLNEIRDAFYNAPRLPLLPGGDADLRNALYDAYRNGDLVIVNASGQETTATRPGDINVGSSGYRIERTKAPEDVSVPDITGKTYAEAESACDAVGLVAQGSGTGTVTAQDPSPGYNVAPGTSVILTTTGDGAGPSGGPGGTPSEVQLGVTLRLSLDDQGKRDNARLLFDAFAEAVDGDASHLEASLKVVVPNDATDEIRARANDLGGHVNETEI